MAEPYKVKSKSGSVYQTADYEDALAWFRFYEHKSGYAELWHKGVCYQMTR